MTVVSAGGVGDPGMLTPTGFFHLRTPLLPAAALEAVFDGGMDAVRALSQRSDMTEALYLASPGLAARWTADRGTDPSLAAAVGAYVVRMATRSTPFGLFAGTATGILGAETRLRVPSRLALARRSRIDTGVLTAVAETLERDPSARCALLFRPTSSLYRAGGSIRYVEARTVGAVRSHHLVALEADDALTTTLARAADGATVDELGTALIDDEITMDDAVAYIAELISSGILVSDLQPPITGPDPVEEMLGVLRRSDATDKAAERLARARQALDRLDAASVGDDEASAVYAAVHEELRELAPNIEPAFLVQVDLFKPDRDLSLGHDVVDELRQAVALLARIAPGDGDGLEDFRTEFDRRYGSRRVPLSEVLDEESGIGFFGSGGHPRVEQAPLLATLDLGGDAEPEGRWTKRDTVLLDLLGDTLGEEDHQLVLNDRDLIALSTPDPKPLPVVFSVMATLIGSDAQLRTGDYRILVHGATGPSGAQLLGRFCAGDTVLEAQVRNHLAAEESHRSDAVFAEVVHLPEGRVGNILRRPVLRHWELAYLGRSGAPADRQLEVNDLTVGLEDGRIVLRCSRLGDREVLPRLATAHNTSHRSVGVYRFLAALQYQGVTSHLVWHWGRLAAARFLPRVSVGRLILARAQWRLDPEEVNALATPNGLAKLRARRRLPRHVAIVEGDNELRLDLDAPVSVAIARHALSNRTSAILVEVLTGTEDLCAAGPDGHFCHELVVPFHQPATPATIPSAPRPTTVRRRFPPGSNWLYLKAYCGPAAADTVVNRAIQPVLDGERWFFVRYGDPDWHVRVRIEGDSSRLMEVVQPRLLGALAPLEAEGRVWRVQLDTYEREVERYGGDRGIVVAEKGFCADTVAVANILALLEGDAAADARWRLALAGIHLLLDDLGYTLEARAG